MIQLPKIYLTDVLKRGANNFDILRLIAALAVIVGHAYSISPQPPLQDGVLSLLHFDYSGSLAVKFFFFLSGLLVTNSIISNQNAFTFLAKRAFRIFPALLFCLLITVFIIGPIFTKFSLFEYFSTSETWKYLSSNFLLTNMRFRLSGVFLDSKFGLNGSLWTLPYEVLCYIYLAILYGLGFFKNKIISNIFFVSIIAISFGLPIYLPTFFSQNAEAHLLPGCFALGALFANNKNILSINLSNSILLCLFTFVLKDSVVFQFIFYITFFYVAIFIASIKFVINKLKMPFDASYGVYVYGFMIQQCVHAVLPNIGVHGNQVITSIFAVAMGIFSWHFIEKRFIDLGHQITNYNDFEVLKLKSIALFRKLKYNFLLRFENNNIRRYLLILFIALVPIIIFLYFYEWRTKVIFGDDLYLFITHANMPTFAQKINLSVISDKYRPVHDLLMHFIIIIFKENFGFYFLFNVLIQSINTFLFALILNLILKSPFISLFISLIIGLSRFSFFNIVQLLNGGALEGLAMSFFLSTVFFLLKSLIQSDLIISKKLKIIIWSIVCANLSLYTHERYIVLLPFIILLLFIAPNLKTLNIKYKAGLSFLIFISIILNILIKKSVYSIPFFVGTGGTNISFSFMNALGFLKDAILSISGINSGPLYLNGFNFKDLPILYQSLTLLLIASVLIIFVKFIIKIWKTKSKKQNGKDANTFILLIILFGLNLAAAIVSIRLEQRWLQASFSIFILLIVFAASKLNFKNIVQKNAMLVILFAMFLWIDTTYLVLGNKNIYLSGGERIVTNFKDAIDKGTIKPNTERLFIWQTSVNENAVNGLSSTLVWGDFFTFYQNKKKTIIFVDSVYERTHNAGLSPLKNFNKKNDQILFIDNGILDITDNFIKDSLKYINQVNLMNLSNNIQYSSTKLIIDNKNFDKFLLNGFYDLENNLRWTNGNASISFLGNYAVKDSLLLTLSIYMIPACKNINPKISLIDSDNKVYQSASSSQSDNKFHFSFYFKESTNLKKINIISQLIDASPDLRTLSFPFASLELISDIKIIK